ncbi:MAG: hypothetical protein RJB39_56 [Candidatus Parcubacteria bacterium]|jgi:hypothetical protein
MSLNKVNPDDSTNDKLLRIEALKRKLYSNARPMHSATQEEALHKHSTKVGHTWVETDAKIAAEEAESKRIAEEEADGVDPGFGSAAYGAYGHYSLAEDAEKNRRLSHVKSKPIDTGLARRIEEHKRNPIGEFLSEKFSSDRAEVIQKKLAAGKVALTYAAAQAKATGSTLYPNLVKKPTPEQIKINEELKAAEVNEADRYHPDFKVFTVGQKRLEDMDFAVHHTGNPTKVQDAIAEAKQREEEEMAQVQKQEKRKRVGFGTIMFLLIFLFFVGALGYAYVYFQKGTNVISSDKIDIAVTGPVSVRSGEVSEFYVDITNRNNAELVQSDLVIQFPEGTKDPADTSKSLNNQRIDVGTVAPGETARRKVGAIFFGEENVKKNVRYSFEFNIEDSNNIFNAEKVVGVFISGSPVTAKIINVKEITNNQELAFDIEVTSNSDEIIKNIQLKVDYPFGFKLIESNVKPVANNNAWAIGDIEALGRKVIKLKGVLVGTTNLEKNFRFTLGVVDEKTGELATVLSTQDQKVSIRKPFVATTLTINGSAEGNKPVQFEDQLQGSIVFRNDLKVPLTDAVVEMRLAGVLIDRTSVKADGGFYRSGDDTLFWDKAESPTLEIINPSETRELSFSMSVSNRRDDLVRILRRATSNLTITVKGKRLNENRVPEEITYGTSRELRLQTELNLSSFVTHISGPSPAEVNQETVYRYTGRITNSANTVKNVVFVAKLPPNGTWKNLYSTNLPAKGVSYSSGKREITLTLGEIPADIGIGKDPIDFYFDFGFTPTLTQKGTTPQIIIAPKISGTDTFTGTTMESGVGALDTSGPGGGGAVSY